MKTKGLQKLDGIISEAIVPNVVIMTDAILEELEAAETENRDPRTSNVIAIYKTRSKDNLSDKQISDLFAVCFKTYQEITRARFLKRQVHNTPSQFKP
jgi:hypothetical protein